MPPLLDQLGHGWIWDTVNTILTPVMWPAGEPSAPDYISIMIKCLFENCGSARCSCVSSGPNASVQVPYSDRDKEND